MLKKLLLLAGGVMFAMTLPLMADFTFDGDAPWTQEAGGVWRSGSISDGQSSSAEMVVMGPAAVSFKWKTSSEGGYDKLIFSIDGSSCGEISGEMTEWEKKGLVVTDGEHSLKWAYCKDGSVLRGEDCGWITDVTVSSVHYFTGTLNANGGVLADGTECNYVENLALGDLPPPTRLGYTFLGWFTAADGGDEVTIATAIASGATIYAHWKEITYTYNYIDNGDGTVTLSCYDENGWSIGDGISPVPVGDFALPGEIDGKRVVGIGSDFFAYGLTSIIIPASVTNLTASAFWNAYNLTNITVEADNPAYKSIDGILYSKDGKTLVSCPRAKGGAITVAAGTEQIGDSAFYSNANIESVTLPAGVTDIQRYAFAYCQNENFSVVTIPASVETIGDAAFGYCYNLSSVTFNGDVSQMDIASYAFWGTPWEAARPFEMIVEGGVVIGYHGTCPATLTAADWPEGVTAIGNSAFNNAQLTSVVIPLTVEQISDGAFARCSNLATVTFAGDRNNVDIADGAFDGTPWAQGNMPTVLIRCDEYGNETENGTVLGGWHGASPVTLDIPEGVTVISGGAFCNCNTLQEITVPTNVTEIGYYAFEACYNLSRAFLPKALEGVIDESSVFYGSPATVYYYEGVEPTYVTATLDAGEGTVDMETVRVIPGNAIGTLPVPTLNGYAFCGWFTAKAGGEKVTPETLVPGDMTIYAHWIESPFVFGGEAPWTYEGDDTWRSGKIDNNGESSSAEMFVVGPAAVSFKWKTSAEKWTGSLRFTIDADYRAEISGLMPDWEERAYMIETGGEHALTWNYSRHYYWGEVQGEGCGWVKDIVVTPLPSFTVTFDANGGTVEGDSQTEWQVCERCALGREGHTEWGAPTRSLPTPTLTGYAFLGWFTAAEGGAEVTAYTVVTADMTLYAHWGAYTYSYIDHGDGTVTLSRFDEHGRWIGNGIWPAPNGDFTIPGEIDGKRVVGIGSDLFGAGLTSIVIPASVTNLTGWVFAYASNLTNITVASANPAYKDIDGILYTKDGKTFVACPSDRRGDIVVAGETEYIGEYAFYNYSHYFVRTVTLPEGLKAIGDYAFNGNWFSSVTIPASVESIGAYAFGNCPNLSTVEFLGAEGDVDIAVSAFFRTPYNASRPFALIVENGWLNGFQGSVPENLDIAQWLDGQTLDGIGYGVFENCTSLRTVRIPPGVTAIFDIFSGCEYLTVYAPETLRDRFSVPYTCTIVYYAVAQYNVTLNANGGRIDGEPSLEGTIYEGRTLENSFPRPVWTSDEFEFGGWYTAAEGGEQVTVVTNDMTVFAHWNPAEPEWYAYPVVDENGEPQSAILEGYSVDFAGAFEIPGAFYFEAHGEPSACVPLGEIAYGAFSERSFTSVTIPASVTIIRDEAFYGCSYLTNVVFLGEMTNIAMHLSSAFGGTPWFEAYRASLSSPDNDDLGDAQVLDGTSGLIAGTTFTATREGADLIPDEYDSWYTCTVWYRWTAPKDGAFVFRVADAHFDDYDGWSCMIGATMGYDANGGYWSDSVVNWRAITINATAGVEYWIEVASNGDEELDFILSWEETVVIEAGENDVAVNGNGSYVITPPAGGVLTAADVETIAVKTRLNGEWVYTTAGYDIAFDGGVITVSLKRAEVDCAVDATLKDPDDKSGFLVKPDWTKTVWGGFVGPYVTLGALPVKTVPGLWYQASWGPRLDAMVEGVKVQAESDKLYLGVERQDGPAGFYGVKVTDK